MSLTLPHEAPTGTAGAGEARPPGILAAVLAGAKRRWLIGVPVGLLLGGLAAAGYYYSTPAKHTVTTTLQISAAESFVPEGGTLVRDLDYRKAQASLVRGRHVIHTALDDKKVAGTALLRSQPDPAGWLEGELKSSVSDGGQLRLSLSGENPVEVAAVLKAITSAYLKVVVDAEKNARTARSSELDTVLAASEDRVRRLRGELRDLAATLHTGDTQTLTVRQQLVLARGAAVQKELLDVEGHLRTARHHANDLKQQAEAAKLDPTPAAVDEALAVDVFVVAAVEQTRLAREILTASTGTVKPGTGGHDKLTADVKVAEQRLSETQAQRRPTVTKQLRDAALKSAAAATAAHEAKVKILEAQHAELKKEVDAALAEAEKMTVGSFDLELKRGEIAEAEILMRKLRGEKERLAIELQTYKPRVAVVVPADPANSKPAASAVTTAAGLGVAGVLLGLFGVGFVESRRRLLHSELDMARVTQARLLGSLPYVPHLDAGPLAAALEERHGVLGYHLAEAIRDVRALLLAAHGGPPPQAVMVTSAGQGEGKTTVACLLAMSLAQSGKRVLLVDGDLRNPRVAGRLGVTEESGVGDLLRGEEARPIKNVGGTSLSVLTAGRPCGTVIDGLTGERVRVLLTKLRKRYDHIVVDSSPISLADGLVIGACVDAVVFVVRHGRTAEPVARQACERMLAASLPLVGGVVNGVPHDRTSARAKYYKPVVALASTPEVAPPAA